MRRYFKIFTLLFIFLSSAIAQTNFVVNPGFEDSVSVGWWLNAWGGARARLFNETGANVISGNISAKVVVDTVGDKIEKVSLMTDTIRNVPAGKELLVTVYARTESQMYLPFKISLKCESADGSKKWYGGDEVTLTTTAQQFSFIVSPDDAYRDAIFVRLSCGLQKGTYIFDDVVFTLNEYVPAPVPDGRRLREIVADKYPDGNVYVGGASQSQYWRTYSEEILYREFNYTTPANDFKQTYIHPQPGVWRWDDPDTWVQKASDNGQVIRMHSPISPQCSKWAKDDSRTGEELLQNLEEYVSELCQRYNQYHHILWMDVVNETIENKTGAWFGPKPGTDSWENPWTIIGFDTLGTLPDTMIVPHYIVRAFELANQYAPNIKQIINQHGDMNAAAWNRVKKLVRFLRAEGLRVDGIGWQGHVDVGWENEANDEGVNNIEALDSLISWAHTNDLDFHITENNVYLPYATETQFKLQAETFKQIFKTLLKHRDAGLVTWNVWMIRDSDGQASSKNPVLFLEDGSAKPAYYAIQTVLEDTTTAIDAVFDGEPRGFMLYDNYPNPFNGATVISYQLPALSDVELTVYNALGQKVAALVNEKQPAGQYSVNFNASGLASGVYFYKLEAAGYTASKRLLLIK